jgi:uncharacterized membrane protein
MIQISNTVTTLAFIQLNLGLTIVATISIAKHTAITLTHITTAIMAVLGVKYGVPQSNHIGFGIFF